MPLCSYNEKSKKNENGNESISQIVPKLKKKQFNKCHMKFIMECSVMMSMVITEQ